MRTVRFLGMVGVLLAAGTASASWPMARHDAKRQAAATGTSNLTAPVPYWRTYLGGTLGGGQLVTADANGDGTLDVIFVSGGQIVAKSINDDVYWKTPPRGMSAIAAIADVDGDGNLDVVANSGDHAYVISAQTGAIEWTEPDGEMGSLGSLRVGDVNGDGKPELIVTECGCCGVNSGKSGFIWTFGGGFGSAHSLGALPIFTCGTSQTITIADADGVAPNEILLGDYDHFALLDGTGSILAATTTQGPWTSGSVCQAVNLDGSPGTEFVCLLNSANPPNTNERKLTALHYDKVGAALNVLWSKSVAPDVGGDMQWVEPVVDLDGDGQYELVVATFDSGTGWQTRIFDALTGNEFTPIGGGEIVQGSVVMEGSNKRLLFTSSGSDLTAWSFTRTPQPTITQRWKVTDRALMQFQRPDLVATTAVNKVALALDLNGDGLNDVVTKVLSGSGSLSGYSSAGTSVASLTLPLGTDAQTGWVVPPLSVKTSQVALMGTDGIMRLLDSSLQPTNRPTAPSQQVAIRVGGYYANGAWRELSNAPRTFALGTGKDEAILVPDSRRALNRFDGTQSSWAIPPPPTWSVSHTFAPTIVSGLDGAKPGVACLALQEPVTNPPLYRARALRADGSVLWDVAQGSTPLADLVVGNFNGDAIPDFALQWAAPGSPNLQTKALSGADGATLWSTIPMYPGAGGILSPGISVGHFDGDAIDDIFFQGNATRALSGTDGNQTGQGGTPNAYGLPILADVDGNNTDEVILSSGFWPVAVYSHDLQTALWTSADDDRPYPYGAVAQCGANPIVPTLVQGSWANPARLKLTPLGGGNTGVFTTKVLANGKVYANEAAAKADGAFLGQLTAANVHSNLTGANHPTAVVGSADGWVYGINPCDGSLDFAVNLGASVGEAVFGDTDGDGKDEIIITAADGYLYDIKNEAIAQPSYVWDTDPSHGITDHDVDTVETTDSLSANWAAVPAATGYEVSVVTKDGKAVPNPVWKNVGTSTSTTLAGLTLTVGSQYFFAVRALSANGPSVDAMSNGVVITSTSQLDGGATDGPAADGGPIIDQGGGCGCALPGQGGTPSGMLAGSLIVLFVVTRRRKRK